eukprot:2992121-Amphidinium_carterae.1
MFRESIEWRACTIIPSDGPHMRPYGDVVSPSDREENNAHQYRSGHTKRFRTHERQKPLADTVLLYFP